MSKRWIVGLVVVGIALVPSGCEDDDSPAISPANGLTPAGAIPSDPPACAGPARDGTEEVRQYAWAQAVAALEEDPDAPVWVGFTRILSLEEVAALPGIEEVSGVRVVFQQQQGTYLTGQQNFAAPIAPDDPTLRDKAQEIMGVDPPPVSLPGIPANALDPVDPAVAAGEPPIAGLIVRGDLSAIVGPDHCLVFSLAIADSDGPETSPVIAPDP